MDQRTGIGLDIHPLVSNRPLLLGGIRIEHTKGLDGTSDGDVLIHSIIDALLGASGQGDIGQHFPSSDPKFHGINSNNMLISVRELLCASGWQIHYVDATILAEHPKLNPYVDKMKSKLASTLQIAANMINIKAKTTDGLGFIGKEEGIAVLAIATINRA